MLRLRLSAKWERRRSVRDVQCARQPEDLKGLPTNRLDELGPPEGVFTRALVFKAKWCV